MEARSFHSFSTNFANVYKMVKLTKKVSKKALSDQLQQERNDMSACFKLK
jgi:hypothetical protein